MVMAMRIISVKALREFWQIHASAEQPLKAWHQAVRKVHWQSPDDIKRLFSTASFLQDNRVVFNIGGNKYRIIVKVRYQLGRVYIRFVGTHAQYDRINANEV